MKVYVVLEDTPESDYEYCGVFKTRKQAEKRIAEIVKDHPLLEKRLYIQEENLIDDIN